MGKTTILKTIVYLFGHGMQNTEQLVGHRVKTGSIELEIASRDKLKALFGNGAAGDNYECILIDGAETRLNPELYKKFLEYLKSTNKQVIMTGLTDSPRVSVLGTRWWELHRQV